MKKTKDKKIKKVLKNDSHKIQQSIELSEEILSDIELNNLPLEQIAYKVLRLGRLIDDYDCIKWINLEIHGYSDKKTIPGISTVEYGQIAIKHGRGTISEGEKGNTQQKYWISSLSELETSISLAETKLKSLVLPSSYQPAVSSTQTEGYFSNAVLKNEYVQETYQNVIQRIRTEQDNISLSLASHKDILARSKNGIYNYVLSTYFQLKYSDFSENIFSGRQKNVMEKLQKDSTYNDIINSIQTNIQSKNSTDWANAVHNCRRLLQLFADQIFPVNAATQEKKQGEKEINLGANNYINRIMAYISSKSDSTTFEEITGSHLKYIGERLDSIYEASNKGTHAKVSKSEAERYIIYTYLIISDILEL